jgi:hypothetical protein
MRVVRGASRQFGAGASRSIIDLSVMLESLNKRGDALGAGGGAEGRVWPKWVASILKSSEFIL